MDKIIDSILNLYDDYSIPAGQGLPWGVFLQNLSGKHKEPLLPELNKLIDLGFIKYNTLSQVYTLNISTENIRGKLNLNH